MNERARRTILVTGGCGFVGVNLISRLAGREHPLRVLDNLSTGRREWLEEVAPDAELVVGDIRDEKTVLRSLDGANAIVHLAASPGVPQSVENPMHDFDHNVKGTLVLLDAARRSGTRRIVLASSNAAASSVSPYGAAKRACEAYGVAFGRCYEMDVLSLRFANVYGPYSTHKTSAVARFIGCALSGDTLPVFGDGNQTRDFVHADDIARGIVLALECPDPGGRSVQIGTGEETSVLQLVETLRRVSGKPLKVRHEPPRAGDIRRGVTDLSAAREALGYEPSLNLEEGLRRTLGWFREQRRSA